MYLIKKTAILTSVLLLNDLVFEAVKVFEAVTQKNRMRYDSKNEVCMYVFYYLILTVLKCDYTLSLSN